MPEKLIQYLSEAHATEAMLIRTLQAHIDVAPRGAYRSLLEEHLVETQGHERRVRQRLLALAGPLDLVKLSASMAMSIGGQLLALSRLPLELVRGSGGEEKLLKNAKDECASEALEIATYLALQRLAEATGERATAELAASIREDETRMLRRLIELIPDLASTVVDAELRGRPHYDVSRTGAADSVRNTARRARRSTPAARRVSSRSRRGASRKRAAA